MVHFVYPGQDFMGLVRMKGWSAQWVLKSVMERSGRVEMRLEVGMEEVYFERRIWEQ